MKWISVYFFLFFALTGLAQKPNFLKVYKINYKLAGSKASFTKILYEVKPAELVLVENGRNIKNRLKNNIDLQFSTLKISDSVSFLDINRHKKILRNMVKISLAASLVGGLAGRKVDNFGIIDPETGESGGFAEAGVILGPLFGIITAPLLSIFSNKFVSEEDLKTQFPVDKLKRYSAKWQIDNKIIVK